MFIELAIGKITYFEVGNFTYKAGFCVYKNLGQLVMIPLSSIRKKSPIIHNRMPKEPPFSAHILESISKTLGDNLTGSQIGKLLADSLIEDIGGPGLTKWRRLYMAFATWQNANQCSNHILNFISNSLQPVLYIGKEQQFQDSRIEINKRLSFFGMEVGETGRLRKVLKSTTINEAEARANKLKHKLQVRNIHEQIFKYCEAELVVENYFHAVFEATKSIAERIREKTGLITDGSPLVDVAFSTSNPLIKINNLSTDTERSEHLGLANICKGLFGIIRNPTAHEPKVKFTIEEEEAIDLLTIISYVHKRLDRIVS